MADQSGWEKKERGTFYVLGETQVDDEGNVVEDGGEVVTEVEGKLVERGTVPFANGRVGRYYVEAADGRKIGVLGSMVLDDYMNDVEIGTEVRIVYRGTERTKGKRDMKQYDVFTR